MDEQIPMSNMTLVQYVALRDALIATPPTAMGSVSIAGRSVAWSSLKEFSEYLAWLEGMIAQLQRAAAGQSRLGFSLANFQNTQ
jgi:hypothetical protein